MNGARLWVTGVGLVTPLGVGVEATWTRLVRGDRAIRPIERFDVSGQRTSVAGEVDGVVVEGQAWSRTSAMAATAAEEAMRAARVDVRGARVGLVVGGTTGGMLETEQLLARLHAEPEHREVLAALRRLPDRQREVLALRYCLDLSPQDVAVAMGISEGTVKSASSRGLAALGRMLKGDQ